MLISTRLKELRLEKELTQKELAEKIGITQDSISLWEKGKRIPDTGYIIKLCEILQISADYLLGRTDDLGIMVPLSVPSQLSPEELKLIEGYRKLAPNLKQTIQELIEFGSQSNKTKRKGEI